jgi:hypothetical protein
MGRVVTRNLWIIEASVDIVWRCLLFPKTGAGGAPEVSVARSSEESIGGIRSLGFFVTQVGSERRAQRKREAVLTWEKCCRGVEKFRRDARLRPSRSGP